MEKKNEALLTQDDIVIEKKTPRNRVQIRDLAIPRLFQGVEGDFKYGVGAAKQPEGRMPQEWQLEGTM